MKNTNLTKILRNMIPPHVKGNVNKKKKYVQVRMFVSL